jgi:DNA polymerase sigma
MNTTYRLDNVNKDYDILTQEIFQLRIALGEVIGQRYRQKIATTPVNAPVPRTKPQNYLEQIIDNISHYKPSEHEQQLKKQFLSFFTGVIHKILGEQFNLTGSIHPFGSSVNGFGTAGCDIDATLIYDTKVELDLAIQIADTVKYYLRTITDKIKSAWVVRWANKPIIKIVSTDDIQCDICSNNLVAIENTKLLGAYCDLDPRVQQLGHVVKIWAKENDLVDAANGSLNSYIFVLMAIWFLQQEKIIPNLQQVENVNRTIVDGYDCTFAPRSDWRTDNTTDLKTLTTRFFKFFYEFNFKRYSISVRTSGVVLAPKDKFVIHIEDPFELRNLGSGMSHNRYNTMKEEMRTSYIALSGDTSYSTKVTPSAKLSWKEKLDQ